MSVLQVKLLGQVNIQLDNFPITGQISHKGLALLCYCWLSGRRHTRSQLAGLLWPDMPEAGALMNLRKTLYRMQPLAGFWIARRESLQFNTAAQAWLDVQAFEQAVTGKPDLSQLEAAAALYQGDFLPGFELAGTLMEDWIQETRARLAELAAGCFQRLTEQYARLNDCEQAVGACRRWLALAPWEEQAHRTMMRLYTHLGRPGEALRQYQECVQALQDELGVEPGEETQRLYQALRTRSLPAQPKGAGAGAPAPAPTPAWTAHNLQPLHTPLVGRQQEMDFIRRTLGGDSECRLLTLVGMGGVGKTRLALEAAWQWANSLDCPFPDGVFWLAAGALEGASALLPALARCLEINPLAGGEGLRGQLVEYLRSRSLLLVLDNFEKLANPQGQQVLLDILESSPQVRLLLTSRSPLNLRSEHLLRLSGLAYPLAAPALAGAQPAAVLQDWSAPALFLQRLRGLQPGKRPDQVEAEDVLEICQLVQGLPLALELAAAWASALSPAEIAASIRGSLDFLDAQWGDLPERQHSLRAVCDSSWAMLSEVERQAIASLALIPGSFSRRAAQATSACAAATLLSLVNKSWLQGLEDLRLQFHPLLRQYALEKLQADGRSLQQARQRFCDFWLDQSRQLARQIQGPEQAGAFQAMAQDFHQLSLSWSWLAEDGRVEQAVEGMLVVLLRYCETTARFNDFRQLAGLALNKVENATCSLSPELRLRLRVLLYTALGGFNFYGLPSFLNENGPCDPQALEQALQLAGGQVRLGELGYLGLLLTYLQGLYRDASQALARLEALRARLERQPLSWELAAACLFSGDVLAFSLYTPKQRKQHLEQIGQYWRRAQAIFEDLGDPVYRAVAATRIGQLYFDQKDHTRALKTYLEALALLNQQKAWYSAASATWLLCAVYTQMGDFNALFATFQETYRQHLARGDLLGASSVLSMESFNASLYSSLEHTRRLCLQRLEITRQAGEGPAYAWACYGMGDVERLAGDELSALSWYEQARLHFARNPDPQAEAFLQGALGELALAREAYAQARQYFLEAIAALPGSYHNYGIGLALSGLGRAETGLGDFASAQAHFLQGLELADTYQEFGVQLHLLVGLCGWYAACGETELAVSLGTMVANHHLCWNDSRTQVRRIFAALPVLPRERFDTAHERGLALSLEQVVASLLQADLALPAGVRA